MYFGSLLLFCGIPNPRLEIKLHYTLQNNKALIKKGNDRCLNAFLQYHLGSLLPWANAGAEVMGRAQVKFIALGVLNCSHVTALLLYSLFAYVRKHNARDPVQTTAAEVTVRVCMSSYITIRDNTKHGNEEPLICAL